MVVFAFVFDCRFWSPYFILSASSTSAKIVGFRLSFTKCERDCHPSQHGLVSLVSLENKKRCMEALRSNRAYKSDGYKTGIQSILH